MPSSTGDCILVRARCEVVMKSLAVLAVLLFLPSCSPGTGGGSSRERKIQEEKTLVDRLKSEVESLGGTMTQEEFPAPVGTGWVVAFSGSPPSEDVMKLMGKAYVRGLALTGPEITDDIVSILPDTLINLTLKDTAVTDQGMEKLAVMPGLLKLDVTGSQVSEAGVSKYREIRMSAPGLLDPVRNTEIIK